MSLTYLRTFRRMPWVYRGMRLENQGRPGRVTDGKGDGVNIHLDGEPAHWRHYCHPHWEMVYYNEQGEIIADYRGKKMKQTYIFYGFSFDGQEACTIAFQKANRFLETYDDIIKHSVITHTFTPVHRGEFDEGTNHCTVQVECTLEKPIILTKDDLASSADLTLQRHLAEQEKEAEPQIVELPESLARMVSTDFTITDSSRREMTPEEYASYYYERHKGSW